MKTNVLQAITQLKVNCSFKVISTFQPLVELWQKSCVS